MVASPEGFAVVWYMIGGFHEQGGELLMYSTLADGSPGNDGRTTESPT